MITEIEVDVPVRTAYNQWTQFEDFPLFMDHVAEVEQVDPTHVRFVATIAGVNREWVAEITEQSPDQRVAWTAIDGTQTSGVVTFHALTDERTRIVLQLELDPAGLLEQVADKGGFVSDRARLDLEGFKRFIEQRGRETGGFRGTIRRDPEQGKKERRERYQRMTRDELRAVASERELPGRSEMTKSELVEALAASDQAAA